jgi:hypothetical protein
MNTGQALGALQTGGNVTCPELGIPGAFLALQQPTGMVTEPFIILLRANGVVTPWTPTHEAMLSTNWAIVNRDAQGAGSGQATMAREHERARG